VAGDREYKKSYRHGMDHELGNDRKENNKNLNMKLSIGSGI